MVNGLRKNLPAWRAKKKKRKMADKFEALEQQLELFIENTRQMGLIVSDFQPQGQSVLNQKM